MALEGVSNRTFLNAWLGLFPAENYVARCSPEFEDSLISANAGVTLMLTHIARDPDNLMASVTKKMDPELQSYLGGACCIIQVQVECVFAGVAFVTHDGLLVEANYGSISATTSGLPPDVTAVFRTYRLELEKARGGPEVPIRRVMSQVHSIATRASQIFEGTVDVEWVFDETTTHLVQARPVTTDMPEF